MMQQRNIFQMNKQAKTPKTERRRQRISKALQCLPTAFISRKRGPLIRLQKVLPTFSGPWPALSSYCTPHTINWKFPFHLQPS